MTKATCIYVVVTPSGHVSETSASFFEEIAIRKYMQAWLPPDVPLPNAYWVDHSLWPQFESAGYHVKQIDLPDELENAEICRT